MAIHGFKMDGDKLVLDVETILQYPILKIIYERDDSIEKSFAFKEFQYMRFLADSKGYIFKSGLSGNKAHEYALENSNLNPSYKPDKYIKSGIEFIKSNLEIHTVERLIGSTVKGLNISGRVVELIVDSMEDILEKGEVTKEELISIEDGLSKLLKQASDIPSKINRLRELNDEWDKSEKGVQVIRGGATYSESYDGEDKGILSGDKSVQELD